MSAPSLGKGENWVYDMPRGYVIELSTGYLCLQKLCKTVKQYIKLR